MATNWKIQEPPNITKILRKLGKSEKNRYFSLIRDFKTVDDPGRLGTMEILKGVKVYVARLNISYRVVYYIIRPNKTIVIIAVGDHKEVGLKE